MKSLNRTHGFGKTLLIVSVMAAGFLFTSCREAKKPSCRKLFDKSYEVNVEAYMKARPELDSATARRQAECALNKLYEIDSTFVLKDGKELEEFINSHRDEITCDSIM